MAAMAAGMDKAVLTRKQPKHQTLLIGGAFLRAYAQRGAPGERSMLFAGLKLARSVFPGYPQTDLPGVQGL
jgi:hypothetical protein